MYVYNYYLSTLNTNDKTLYRIIIFCFAVVSWRNEEVNLLISLYIENKELFTSSCVKQGEVWRRIGNGMQENGYSYTGEQCDKKFRSLKYRYVNEFYCWISLTPDVAQSS